MMPKKETHMPRAKLSDFEAALAIDRDALDEGLLQQPDIFYRVSKEYVRACAKRDTAYDNVKIITANIDIHLRQVAENNDIKTTDRKIESEVKASKEYKEVVETHLHRRADAEAWGALKDAFQQRSYMLRELVSLYTANYYADATVSPQRGPVADAAHEGRLKRAAAKRKPLKKK